MFRQLCQCSAQSLTALILTITLGACAGSREEPFAPELRKDYVLTENLVLTSYPVTPPGLFKGQQTAPYVMTYEQYNFVKNVINQYPHLPNLGEVMRGSRVQVQQIFIVWEPSAVVREGKLRFADPATGSQLTAYVGWNYVEPKLKEVKQAE